MIVAHVGAGLICEAHGPQGMKAAKGLTTKGVWCPRSALPRFLTETKLLGIGTGLGGGKLVGLEI